MKRVIISQRSDALPDRVETRDSLDERLAAILWSLGFLPIPICNAINAHTEYLRALKPDAVLLSGGRDIGTTPLRDAMEAATLDLATARRLPVFGLCRGMQMLNHHQGGRSITGSGHVACRHIIQGPLFSAPLEVNSYHDQFIAQSGLAPTLEALAFAPDGTVEALHHRDLPWLGVMWHPERDTPPDPATLRLISAHLNPTEK